MVWKMQLGPPIYTEHEKEEAIRNCQNSQYKSKKGVPEGSKKEEGGVHPYTNEPDKCVPDETGDKNKTMKKKRNNRNNKKKGSDTVKSVEEELKMSELFYAVMTEYKATLIRDD